MLGNNATSTWNIPFVCDSADDVEVVYTNASGVPLTLLPSQYLLTLNTPAVGTLWGIGATLVYPLMGAPISNGTSLTVSRILPLTQTITIANQGDFAPQVIEEMGDTLIMQIQQVAARTGQIRGTWASGTAYNYADIVLDGAAGSNTNSYYFCAIANTSGTWTTDLGNGDWSLAFPAVQNIAVSSITVVGGAATFDTLTNNFTVLTTNGNVSIETVLGGQIDIITFSGGDINIQTQGASNIALQSGGTLTISGANGSLDGLIIGANSPQDCTVSAFHAIGTTTLDSGASCAQNVRMTTANAGLTLKRGSNGRVGTVIITGTTAVSVTNSLISTSDLISFSLNTVGGTVGAIPVVKTLTPNTSFTVAGSVGDISTYNYYITKSAV